MRICTPETAPYWTIVDVIRQELGFDRSMLEEVDTQIICLTEELGEAAKAWRRHSNRARVHEDLDHVTEELADVIISANVTLLMLGADPTSVVRKKLLAIVERGGR